MSESKSTTRIRAGVIGAGFIGPVHMEALQRLGVQVSAVCDFDEAKARAAAERWNIPRIVTGKDYLPLVQGDDVDVVHITSPNRYHHEMTIAALRAGKSCICEKPLAMTSKETAAIVRLAAKSPGVFAVNYNLRFYPAVLQLRAAVSRGELGEIIHVNGSYFQDWLLKDTDYNWRLLPEEGGKLRAVGDIGTHWFDTMSFILGARITQLLAHLETHHKSRKRPIGEVQTFARAAAKQRYVEYPVKTEDFASVLIRFDNGTHGNVAISQVAAGRKNSLRIEIYGSKKSAWWNSEEPNSIVYGSRDGANEVSLRQTPGFSQDVAGFTDYPPGHAEGFPDTFKMLYRSVYQDVMGGKSSHPMYATAEDGHHEVKLCEAVLKSSSRGRWVKV